MSVLQGHHVRVDVSGDDRVAAGPGKEVLSETDTKISVQVLKLKF